MKFCFIALFILIASLLNANIFMDISAGLSSVTNGTVSWADFDSDGYLDLLITGRNDELSPSLRSRLFRNDNGIFLNQTVNIPGLYQSATAWCDIDNDNDLDLVICGNTSTTTDPSPITSLYENINGTLVLSDMYLVPVSRGTLSWIDVDKDGFKDLLITGDASSISTPQPVSVLYHNNHGILTESDMTFLNVYESAATVFDYNSDGYDDILISGNNGDDIAPSAVTRLYKNTSGTFSEVQTTLPDVRLPSLDWADYDQDGDPDLILSGYSDVLGQSITSIYTINLSNFTPIASDFFPVSPSSITWGDYDIDGDMDLLFTGNTILGGLLEPITALYRNDDSLFLYIYDSPVTVLNGMAAFGDYDADNDLDIALTGEHPLCPGGPITRIYRNDITTLNHLPTIPTGSASSFNNGVALFQWEQSTDTETNQVSLTYNLRIGTTPGGSEILSPMADVLTGRSYLPQKGNSRYSHTKKIPGLADGTYYWSVQAIDDSYSSSPFAEEQTLVVNSTSTHDETAPSVSVSVYPNPFSSLATFEIHNTKSRINKVRIFNLRGQLVKEFFQSDKTGSMTWDGKDSIGNRCGNGVFFYRISTGDQTRTGKILYFR